MGPGFAPTYANISCLGGLLKEKQESTFVHFSNSSKPFWPPCPMPMWLEWYFDFKLNYIKTNQIQILISIDNQCPKPGRDFGFKRNKFNKIKLN